MFCCKTCGIAVVFLIANLYVTLSTGKSKDEKQDFYDVLNENQKTLYEQITEERKRIYYMGFILGIILSYIVYYINKKVWNQRLNNMSLVCLVGAVTLVTNYLFYILYPKSDYMLLHLSDKRQIEEWLKIYKTMQFKFHIGFVLGIIAVMVFCYSFRRE